MCYCLSIHFQNIGGKAELEYLLKMYIPFKTLITLSCSQFTSMWFVADLVLSFSQTSPIHKCACTYAHTRARAHTYTECTCTHTQTQTHTRMQIRIKVSVPNSAVEKTSLRDFLPSSCLFPLQRLRRASVSRLGNLLVEDTIYFQGNEGFAHSSLK